MEKPLVPLEHIESRILQLRGQKVMLDADLAELYGVETRTLVQAVKRNLARFPADFMFQLDEIEWTALRSQFVISKGRGGRRYAPYAFTEHGALMLSSILSSEKAIDIGIHIVRAFVQLRELVASHHELAAKLDDLEDKVASHDQAIAGLIDTLRRLTATPPRNKRPIGFIEPE